METLEVVIGLIFIFLLLSLLATTVQELSASLISLRGRMLLKAIMKLLEVENLAGTEDEAKKKEVLESFKKKILASKVYQKYSSKFLWIKQIPSYLSAEQVTGLIQELMEENTTAEVAQDTGTQERSLNAPQSPTMLNVIQQDDLKKQLQVICGQDNYNAFLGTRSIDGAPEDEDARMAKAKAGFKKNYDEIMDRATDWYKRSIQMRIVVIGLLIALAFDADTIKIYSNLTHNPQDRQELLQLAESFVANDQLAKYTPPAKDITNTSDTAALARVSDLKSLVDSILVNEIRNVPAPLGLGWQRSLFEQADDAEKAGRSPVLFYLFKLFGWLVTALAISLGAPFWFDMLQKVVNIRNAGVRPQTGEEQEAQ